MNPNINPNMNPNMNPNINPNMNPNINPNMNPNLLVFLVFVARAVSTLTAGLTTTVIMQQIIMHQGSALGSSVTQATNKTFMAKLGLLVFDYPARSLFEALNKVSGGVLKPVVNLLSLFVGHGSNVETGLLIKVLAKPGEQITIVTGPDFAMFVIKHGTYIIIGIVLFVTVKFVADKVIAHTCTFLYYKNNVDKSNENENENKNEIESIIPPNRSNRLIT